MAEIKLLMSQKIPFEALSAYVANGEAIDCSTNITIPPHDDECPSIIVSAIQKEHAGMRLSVSRRQHGTGDPDQYLSATVL